MKEMSELICGKAAVGGNYNSTRDNWVQMIQDNMVAILGWIQYEKVKWLQNNNPEIPGLVYKLSPNEEKARKLEPDAHGLFS